MKISIDETGTVTANYSNGERIKVSQIVLAKFANFGGLSKEGQNLFSATDAAGPPRTGIPGAELGNLFTNALEQSTVDLAAEFVKMITTQRGFQANSRVITTTDEMLGELINLKR
jgi:flagellar hook protein FlgE